MEKPEIKERYTVTKPNPKNKKASPWIIDQKTDEYLNIEAALARILNILDKEK